MKKNILLLVVLAMLSANAFAQFGVSVKGGALFCIIDKSGGVDYDQTLFPDPILGKQKALTTFTAEVTANYYLNDNISFSTGFGYDGLGYTLKINSETKQIAGLLGQSIDDLTHRLSYLSVPLYATYVFNFGKFYAGADLGLKLNICVDVEEEGFVNDGEVDITDKYQNVVPYLLAGLKAGYNITNKISLDITGRYNFSLSNARNGETNNGITYKDEKYSAASLFFGVNYKF